MPRLADTDSTWAFELFHACLAAPRLICPTVFFGAIQRQGFAVNAHVKSAARPRCAQALDMSTHCIKRGCFDFQDVLHGLRALIRARCLQGLSGNHSVALLLNSAIDYVAHHSETCCASARRLKPCHLLGRPRLSRFPSTKPVTIYAIWSPPVVTSLGVSNTQFFVFFFRLDLAGLQFRLLV